MRSEKLRLLVLCTSLFALAFLGIYSFVKSISSFLDDYESITDDYTTFEDFE